MKTFLLVLSLMLSQGVWAFSDLGHKLIAAAAWQQLTPFAKQQVEQIIGVGQSQFVNASVWADHIKSNNAFDYLKPLHYVNLPKDARRYDAQRDCPKQACVVEAIKQYSNEIKQGDGKQKKLALRMLIHLIADVHQPLHAGLYKDRGGNWYEIKYQNKPMSLHKFWDNQAVKRFDRKLESGVQTLMQMKVQTTLASPEIWAEESHGLVLDVVYQAKENQPLSDDYLQQVDQVMAKRLSEASWRLAMWLNRLW